MVAASAASPCPPAARCSRSGGRVTSDRPLLGAGAEGGRGGGCGCLVVVCGAKVCVRGSCRIVSGSRHIWRGAAIRKAGAGVAEEAQRGEAQTADEHNITVLNSCQSLYHRREDSLSAHAADQSSDAAPECIRHRRL